MFLKFLNLEVKFFRNSINSLERDYISFITFISYINLTELFSFSFISSCYLKSVCFWMPISSRWDSYVLTGVEKKDRNQDTLCKIGNVVIFWLASYSTTEPLLCSKLCFVSDMTHPSCFSVIPVIFPMDSPSKLQGARY